MRRKHVRWLVPVAALAGASLLSATAAGAEKPVPADGPLTAAVASGTSGATGDVTAATAVPLAGAPTTVLGTAPTTAPAPVTLAVIPSLSSMTAAAATGADTTTTTTPDPDGPEAPPYATPLADDPCDPDYLSACPGEADSAEIAARAGARVAENPPIYALAATVREGYSRHRVLRIPVLLDWATPNGVTVHWRTSSRWGTAQSGSDYIATSGDITFPPAGTRGATIQLIKIDIPPNGPTIRNQEFETMRVVLSKPVGVYFPGRNGRPRKTLSVTGVILDIRTAYGPPFN